MFPSASYIRYSVYYILFSVFLLIKILVMIPATLTAGKSGSFQLPHSAFPIPHSAHL